jgi:hypothetical protein
MAGPWLYAISAAAGRTFDLGGGKAPINVTIESYRTLVENEQLAEDRYWYISQLWKAVEIGDELFIYSGKKILASLVTDESMEWKNTLVASASYLISTLKNVGAC